MPHFQRIYYLFLYCDFVLHSVLDALTYSRYQLWEKLPCILLQYVCSDPVDIISIKEKLMCTIQFQPLLVCLNLPSGILWSKVAESAPKCNNTKIHRYSTNYFTAGLAMQGHLLNHHSNPTICKYIDAAQITSQRKKKGNKVQTIIKLITNILTKLTPQVTWKVGDWTTSKYLFQEFWFTL